MRKTESIRVLHVDDDPMVLDLTAELLGREDDRLRVVAKTSASDGLEALKYDSFECVVSDYELPGENGIEFLETIRETHPDIPFILFTSKGSEEVASDAISAGVSDYLQKGMGTERFSLLANRITNLVAQYRAETQLETRAEQQERVAELGQQALAGCELAALFSDAVEVVAGTLGTEVAEILEYRDEQDALLVRDGVGVADEKIGSAMIDVTDELQAGAALGVNEPVVVDSTREETRFDTTDRFEYDIGSGISVVIGSQNNPWGVLGTYSAAPRSYTSDDVSFVQTIANVLGAAIERAEAEEELRETHDRYERILEHLSDYVIIVDGSGTISYASPAIERAMGFTPEEVIESNAFEYVHPDDHEIAMNAFAATIEDPEQEVRVEYRAKTADGSFRWIEARGNNYLDDPLIQGILVSVRDISERKALESTSK